MLNFLKSLFLTILSLLLILIFRNKRNIKGNFTSVKKEFKENFDPRTNIYLDKDAVKIVRSQNFLLGIQTLLRNKNIIFFNHILNLNYFFGKLFFIKREKTEKFNIKTLFFIFKKFKLKEFHMIDDYRHVKFFSKVCKLSKTRLILYQHGRFSKSIKIQKNLVNLFFSKYFVWSNFFKKKLLTIDNSINDDQIIIRKKYQTFKSNYKNYSKNILIVHENEISIKDYKSIINQILNNNVEYNIFFKIRPYEKKNENLEIFLKKNKIKMIKGKNIYSYFKSIKFYFLIAFNSTLLLEASFFQIAPIMVYKKKPALQDYLKDNVFFISKINQLDKNLNYFLNKRKKNLKQFKQKIWH